MTARKKLQLPEITARNMLKPEGLWVAGIHRWEGGDPAGIRELLKGEEPIPPFVREWLAIAISGEVKPAKKRGRKPQEGLHGIAAAIFQEMEIKAYFHRCKLVAQVGKKEERHGTPKEIALSLCSERYGLTEDEISHIVYPRKKRGDNSA